MTRHLFLYSICTIGLNLLIPPSFIIRPGHAIFWKRRSAPTVRSQHAWNHPGIGGIFLWRLATTLPLSARRPSPPSSCRTALSPRGVRAHRRVWSPLAYRAPAVCRIGPLNFHRVGFPVQGAFRVASQIPTLTSTIAPVTATPATPGVNQRTPRNKMWPCGATASLHPASAS